MKDLYKANIISQHIEAAKNDEYYFAQVTGTAGKPINLDEGALTLLKNYYEGQNSFPMRSAEEVIASRDENNYVEGFIEVHVSTMIDNDFESFLDIISEELVGSDLLMDVNYDVVGLEEGISSYHNDRPWVFKDEVLQIIDKYKAEMCEVE